MYLNQLAIFKELNPYSGGIDTNNRWIKLAKLIPWDEMEGIYRRSFSKCKHSIIKPSRLMLGLMIGEMFMQTDDRDILEYFHENPYFQYFCGQESFVPKLDGKAICHHSLLSKRRKRLGKKYTNEFERLILEMLKEKGLIKGNKLVLDATVFPVNISYPNDVKLLNSTREWACETILRVKRILDPTRKIRTYRRVARRTYLNFCKKKRKKKVFINKTVKQMIRFTARNIVQLEALIAELENKLTTVTHIAKTSLTAIQETLRTAKTILEQQTYRVTTRGARIKGRIVSLHRPQVRPIVRGKEGKNVEFGAKAQVSNVDGFVFLDDCQYDNFNEGIRLPSSLEKHRQRFDKLPNETMGDQIYATRDNRALLDSEGIQHNWPDLGRPTSNPDQPTKKRKAATRKRQRGRNCIEGAFGTVKSHCNLEKIIWSVPGGETMQIQLGLTTFNLRKALNYA